MSVKQRLQDMVSVCHDYADFNEAKISTHKKHKSDMHIGMSKWITIMCKML